MVASRACHNAAIQVLSRQVSHFVVRAPDLEGENRLCILPLQIDFVVEQGAQVLGMLQFGLNGCLVHPGVQHLAEISHGMLLRIEQHGHFDALLIGGKANHFVSGVVALVSSAVVDSCGGSL